MQNKRLVIYKSSDGKCPFEDWLYSFKDKKLMARIVQRIDRVRLGNFGDCKSIGLGLYELRLHFGSGYRIYFSIIGEDLVLLLCGGDKKTQKKDIKSAQSFLEEYRANGN